MTISARHLMGLTRPVRRVVLDPRTAMHYGLAVGMAAGGSADERELRFVLETGLSPVPSLATVLGYDDSWIEPAGLDMRRIVHGAQKLRFLAPLRPDSELIVAFAIAGVVDKGAGRGTIIVQEARLDDAATGAPVAVGHSSLFVRGIGGGGSEGVDPRPHALPARVPDLVRVTPTSPNQALWFRLLGDLNPLHADPAVARAVGFDRPILHGACTYGIACATVLRTVCGLDPARLRAFEARFVGPVFPGEDLAFLLWQDGDVVSFRAIATARGAVVLDKGRAELAVSAPAS